MKLWNENEEGKKLNMNKRNEDGSRGREEVKKQGKGGCGEEKRKKEKRKEEKRKEERRKKKRKREEEVRHKEKIVNGCKDKNKIKLKKEYKVSQSIG